MATGGVETPDCPQTLMCPVCLDLFEQATLLHCGHTFCRKCLMEHDASSQFSDHVECPVCRGRTKLRANRVEGLPSNVTVNGLVDDYRNNKGGLFASPTHAVKGVRKRDVKKRAGDLIKRCKVKMKDLDKSIKNTEARRQEVHTMFGELELEVSKEYEEKAKHLENNKRLLVERLRSMNKAFNEKFNALKTKDAEKIKIISSSLQLVANGSLERLNEDGLPVQSRLGDDLERIFNMVQGDTNAGYISKTAREHVFRPADRSLLHLGEISTRPIVRVKKAVDLRDGMCGMTALSEDSVIIGYNAAKGADKINSEGNTSQHLPNDGRYYDLAHQSNIGNTAAVQLHTDQLWMYAQDGTCICSRTISDCASLPSISSNAQSEIIIANTENCMSIYDPSISTKLCSIKTDYKPCQAFETRSGDIIASTCMHTDPSKVTAYDRSGRVGDTLTADPGGILYAAVDSQDRVYVASVNQEAGTVVIAQYEMDGLKFRKVFQFEELKLTLGLIWCYMVSLSRDMLAFACDKKLYFIEVHPS